MTNSISDIFENAGAAMWIIIGCSVLAVAVGLERFFAMWGFLQKSQALSDTVNRCVARGAVAEARAACERSKSPLADVYLVGFERHGRGSLEALAGAVDRARIRMNLEFKRRLWVLGTVGAMAPFVGLYGTVVGIMGAFQGLKGTEGKNQLDIVGPAISEALVATAAGILVAVVAVVIFNWLSAHMQRVALEIKLLTEEFLEALSGERIPDPSDAASSSKGKSAATSESVADGNR